MDVKLSQESFRQDIRRKNSFYSNFFVAGSETVAWPVCRDGRMNLAEPFCLSTFLLLFFSIWSGAENENSFLILFVFEMNLLFTTVRPPCMS
jgi:hypothetical protein